MLLLRLCQTIQTLSKALSLQKEGNGFGPLEELLSQFSQTFTHEQLTKGRSSLPDFVDKSRLEVPFKFP